MHAAPATPQRPMVVMGESKMIAVSALWISASGDFYLNITAACVASSMGDDVAIGRWARRCVTGVGQKLIFEVLRRPPA